MKHFRLQSLLKVLVLSITFFVFYGCVTPYSPPTLSDFSMQEIDNLVAQVARPATTTEHNLSTADLIGEWDLTQYNISSCAINKGRKSKSRMITKSRFQFYENMTFREFWKFYNVEASGITALGGGQLGSIHMKMG